MKRVPVTKASYKKISTGDTGPKGVPDKPQVKSGKVDKKKTREASYLGWGGFGSTFGRPTMIGASTTFYNNSYMNGGRSGGLGDIPNYMILLNEANGGVLYYPATLKERYEWYRYFTRADPYVKAAVELNTDLPLSRLQLRMPKMEDKKLCRRIQKFYESMMDDLHLYDKLHSILFEYNVIGNAFVFAEYSEEKKRWDKLTIFPPEEVNVANYPLSDVKRVQYRPEMLSSTIQKYDMPVDTYESYMAWIKTLPDEDKNVLRDVSYELVKQIKEHNGVLTFDTDPYQGDGDDKIGSFVYHFAHKRHEYQDLGVSPLECVMTSLLQKTHYMFTQLNLASRNMTPRNIVTAEKISEEALEDLRDQVDQSMLSPDYSIVTNYSIQWEQLGAENRLIDLARENEVIENQLFAGLGVTRELLTGEGMYSGNKISVEILNTKYLLVREMLQKFVEESLFKPVALQNGFYHDDEDGNREWFYPKVGFTRLTIRDNQEVFDQLFQLYQKGSLPISMILDIFNINSDEVEEDMKRDMFTVNDPTYNEMLRNIYTGIGDGIVENTDIVRQVAESITGPMGRKLKYKGEDAAEPAEAFNLGGDEAEDEQEEEDEQDENAVKYIEKVVKEEEKKGPPEESSSSSEPSAEQPAGETGRQPPAGNAPQSSGDVLKYLDMIKDEDERARVIEYIRGVVENEKAKEYIDKAVAEEQKAGPADASSGSASDKYIEKVVGEEKAAVDEAAKEYIESFIGEDSGTDDMSDEAQSAGL